MTILQIQCLLQYLGYYTITVDGIWGQGSEQATKDFQKAEGLEDDGIPGKLTQAALLDAVAKGRFKAADTTQPDSEETGTEALWWNDIKYFTRAEFRCKCGGKYCNGFPAEPQEGMVRAIDNVREHFGKAFTPNSGVRCPTHNANVGGVSNSRHLYGKAVDFHVPGKTAAQVLAYLATLPGLGYCYAIDADNVHMDIA